MIEVKIQDGQFEKGMRVFKKACMNDGFMLELRERRYFIKPSERKRKKRKEAKRNSK
jgi:small subunit ribosomal protein S21